MLSDVGRPRDKGGAAKNEFAWRVGRHGAVRHPCLMLPSIQTQETVITILTSLIGCHLVISCSS